MNKPLSRLYPEKLETIGDHLRTKRLDLKLGQKDLEKPLGACLAIILLWEKNKVVPQPKFIAKINQFLGYCVLPNQTVEHVGNQLSLFRVQTLGLTIFELANVIGIDEGTLSEFEKTNIIRHTRVLNAINLFLKKHNWCICKNTKTQFIPTRIRCNGKPRFHTPDNEPQTLGQHIALKRKQLKLTQAEVMEIIGVKSMSTYRKWEKHGTKPRVKYYPKIMEFLGCCPIHTQYPS